jgi:putative ABC transport system ATP-binding protein
VFQAFYLVPYLSVLDNVILPVEYLDSRYRKELFKDKSPEEKGKEILERLGMAERINFKPDQLSGGQKQRTAIARALINSPEIILADEPTGQLDTESGRAVMEIFTELNREGKTIIVVTHDPAVASYANRIIKIKDGRIE